MSDYNAERSRELAEILLAEANGEKIEWSYNKTHWGDVCYSVLQDITDAYSAWVSEELFFRVKPKPKRIAFCEHCGRLNIESRILTDGHKVTCPGGEVYRFYEKDRIQEEG